MWPQPSVNYERFPSEYFSGSDIRVYFEGILIDEITDLQFSLIEKVLPIFGYNSYTYDAIARGSRIIQGTFAINFKDVDYLKTAVENILNDPERYVVADNYAATEQYASKYNRDPQLNRNTLYHYLERGWTSKFEELANQYEEMIWGTALGRNDMSKATGPYFPVSSGDMSVSFDIIITYGPYAKDRYYAREGFGHDVELEYYRHVNQGTVKSIHNVQLTGVSQVIDTSGQPIKEVYTFLARDLDRVK